MGGRGFEAQRRRAETLKASRGEEWGVGFPPQPTKGFRERRELPQWGPGRSPGRKTDFSAYQASQNACRWDVCRKLTSCQKTLLMEQDAQLSQGDRAAGCVIVFASSRRL